MSKIDRLVGQVMAAAAVREKRLEDRKKAKAEARRKRIEQERAEIWDDREGKARPTPQRLLKGVFSLRDAEDAGVSVAVDCMSCVIDRLAETGTITARQREAGHIFESAARGALGSPAGRSCVDFSPVGYDGDDDDEDAARANKRWSSLRRMIRPDDRREMMAVCWQNAKPQRLEQLRRGLDATADWAGLEPERKI